METLDRRAIAPFVRVVVGASLLGLGVLTATAAAVADGARDGNRASSGRVEDPDYTAAVSSIKAREYAKAIPLLEGVVARNQRDADAYNWLAYAIRRNGDAARSIPLYDKALAIDPKHRGAHEYIGEAYLALDNLPKAKEHLKRLDSLCFLPCEEYRDLKKAVEAFEQSGGKVKPAGH